MSSDDFSKQQYISLRAEISESKSRVFWLLIVGIFLVLASGYLAAAPDPRVRVRTRNRYMSAVI